jgi:hypothetical protein
VTAVSKMDSVKANKDLSVMVESTKTTLEKTTGGKAYTSSSGNDFNTGRAQASPQQGSPTYNNTFVQNAPSFAGIPILGAGF